MTLAIFPNTSMMTGKGKEMSKEQDISAWPVTPLLDTAWDSGDFTWHKSGYGGCVQTEETIASHSGDAYKQWMSQVAGADEKIQANVHKGRRRYVKRGYPKNRKSRKGK